MGIYLNPGNEAFKISISSEIYVDKSELISFTNSKIGQEKRFICVSRPRRFGKSMAANMLCAYYSRECESTELFQDYKIASQNTFLKYINQFHVLYFEMQRFLTRAGSPENLVPYLEKVILSELRSAYPEYVDDSAEHLSPTLEKYMPLIKQALYSLLMNGIVFSGKQKKIKLLNKYILIF